MKTGVLVYIILSILLKQWHERNRNKLFPVLIERNVERGLAAMQLQERAVRVQIRGRQEDVPAAG